MNKEKKRLEEVFNKDYKNLYYEVKSTYDLLLESNKQQRIKIRDLEKQVKFYKDIIKGFLRSIV